MSKIVLLGDTHNGASKSSSILQDYFMKFYDFLFEYMDQNDVKTIIQTGDFFDQRKDVHFTTIQQTNEYFFEPLKRHGIDLYIISGNHDCTFKNHNRTNSVDLLCRDKATVIDLVPKTVSIGGESFDLYPWISPDNLSATLEFCKLSNSKYAVGHFEFNGFPMHPGTLAETGMNHTIFSRYVQVFSGHYHTISQRDNVLYTGTPYELNWSDWSDPKGFWVLDTESGVREFIRNPFTLFEKISYVEGLSYDFTQVKEKYVKIVIIESKDQKKFDAFLMNVNLNQPHDVKVIEASIQDAVSSAVGVTDLVSTNQMIANVIDNMEIDLDKTTLKNYVMELYSEAMVINNAL